MKTLNIHEAKTQLSKLLEEVTSGETIVIAKAGKPIAKLVPFSSSKTQRTGGSLSGEIWEASDAWDSDEDLNSQFTDTPLYQDGISAPSAKIAEAEAAYAPKE